MKQISICCIAVYYKTNVEYCYSRLAKNNGISNEVLESLLNEQYPLYNSEEGYKQDSP